MSVSEKISTAQHCPSWQKSTTVLGHPAQVLGALLGLLTMQFAILPSLFPSIVIDGIPIWIVFLCVTRNPRSVYWWTFVTVSILETHTSAPRGLYFLAYSAMVTVILIFKDHISWKFIFPWSVVIFLSYIWIILSESVSISALNESTLNIQEVIMNSSMRILTGLAIGISFANYLILRKRETLEYQ